MSKCRRLSGSYSFTKGTLRLSREQKSCSEMRSPVDARFSVVVITCCCPHSKGSARGCKLSRIRPGNTPRPSPLETPESGEVHGRASFLYISLAYSRPVPDVAITRTLPAGPLMNWVHPSVCPPPPEGLISTAHIGRSVLSKRRDLYHKVPSNPALSQCCRFSVRCRLQ